MLLTYDEAKRLVVLALSNFPAMQDKDMKATAMLWQKLLADLTYEQAEAALVKTLFSAKFFPTIAEIREAHKAIVNAGIPTAEEAWKEVLRNLNPYRAPQWSCPIIQDAVRTMGFLQLCNSENPSIDRAQFIKIYNNLRDRQQDRQENEVVVRLVGGTVKLIG
jgi:hypothetical protein